MGNVYSSKINFIYEYFESMLFKIYIDVHLLRICVTGD
jgi:hypothetical protein